MPVMWFVRVHVPVSPNMSTMFRERPLPCGSCEERPHPRAWKEDQSVTLKRET